MATEDPLQLSDSYDESDDSDFVEGNDDAVSSASDGEEAGDVARPAKKRKVANADGDIEMAELDSGDEAMIQRAKEKRRKKKTKKAKKQGKQLDDDVAEYSDEDSDADARPGFVRTRRMRAQFKEEQKKAAVGSGVVTVDVNQLWQLMNDPNSAIGTTPVSSNENDPKPTEQAEEVKKAAEPQKINLDEMITIKRKYRFAGETHVEEKQVPKESREAREYLATLEGKDPNSDDAAVESEGPPLRRPLRKLSRFDPNPNGVINKNWAKVALPKPGEKTAAQLNTVQKSQLDWVGYVDREGIQEELEQRGKAKEGFHGRQAFLRQTEQRREEEARQARISARG